MPQEFSRIKSTPGAIPGAEIANRASGSFLFIKDLRNFKRNMVVDAEEVLFNCYHFIPNWVKHASIYVQKYQRSSHKAVFRIRIRMDPH